MQTYLISVCIALLIGGGLSGLGVWQYKTAVEKSLRMELAASQEANKTLAKQIKKDQATCESRLKSKDTAIRNMRRIDGLKTKKDEAGNIMPDDPILADLNGMWKNPDKE